MKTGSSAFFIDALKSYADVTVKHFDPGNVANSLAALSSTDWSRFDLVIVWQLEVLAVMPMSVGTPTLIIPMYDGSGGMPNAHWHLLRGASVINFSYTLHLAMRDVMANSALLKYFPDPARFTPTKDFSTLRGLFWQRNAAEISAETVFGLVRGPIARWHVHLAADAGPETPLPQNAPTPVSTSTWFPSRSDFEALVDRYNVMVCPRRSEGIGMFMLECMARGMCVVAPALPVHTEYISDGVTGLLFEPDALRPVSVQNAAAIGEQARRAVEVGHQRFVQQIARIPDFIHKAARTRPSWAPKPARARQLVEAYFNDPADYNRQLKELVPIERVAPGEVEGANLAVRLHSGEPWQVQTWRGRMQRVPGWTRVKSLVPNVWKREVAKLLARLSSF